MKKKRAGDLAIADRFTLGDQVFTVLEPFSVDDGWVRVLNNDYRSRVKLEFYPDQELELAPIKLSPAQRLTLADALSGHLSYQAPRVAGRARSGWQSCQFWSSNLARPNRRAAGLNPDVRVTESAITLAALGVLDVTDWDGTGGLPFVTEVGHLVARREGM